jgi:NAD(P)H-dependent FMN reductase
MLSSAQNSGALPRIAVIVGSNRRDSINRKLAQALVGLGAGKFGASFARIDDLPMFNQDNEGNLPPEVVRFKLASLVAVGREQIALSEI